MKFTDIHGHYAWDIDDGIQTMPETVKALRIASQQGISHIVATPHMCCGKIDQDNRAILMKRMESFKKLAQRYSIDVTFGCELMLNQKIKDTLAEDLFIPIGKTPYLLCEDDVRKKEPDFIEVFDIYLKEVIYAGYKPIVAHVERYFHDDIDLEFTRYLIDMGCYIQVNTTSILGLSHAQHHKNALKLIDSQLIHIIATDTHQAEGTRVPNMKECYDYLLKKGYQERYIHLLMNENPKRVVNNRTLLTPHFHSTKKLFSFLK